MAEGNSVSAGTSAHPILPFNLPTEMSIEETGGMYPYMAGSGY